MKIIYIAGSSRSGSTFLEMLLSSHPEIIGLGEIGLLLKKYINEKKEIRDILCSCGKLASECDFWGQLMPELRNESLESAHFKIRHYFEAMHSDKILLDCSKSREYLTKYYLNKNCENHGTLELKVLFLIRDYRGWSLSIGKNRKNGGEINYGFIYNSYAWLYSNLKTLTFLKQKKIDFMCTLYENIIFNPSTELSRISDFIGITYKPDIFNLKDAKSHELHGNDMRHDPVKSNKIYYDNSWIRDWRPTILQPLLLPVMSFNHYLYSKYS
jgi:hypothetical protein